MIVFPSWNRLLYLFIYLFMQHMLIQTVVGVGGQPMAGICDLNNGLCSDYILTLFSLNVCVRTMLWQKLPKQNKNTAKSCSSMPSALLQAAVGIWIQLESDMEAFHCFFAFSFCQVDKVTYSSFRSHCLWASFIKGTKCIHGFPGKKMGISSPPTCPQTSMDTHTNGQLTRGMHWQPCFLFWILHGFGVEDLQAGPQPKTEPSVIPPQLIYTAAAGWCLRRVFAALA